MRCRKLGIPAPNVIFVDESRGIIAVEWVEGCSIKEFLFSGPPEEEALRVVRSLGRAIAHLHDADVVHGDLTTSNFMVRASDGEVVRCG